MSTAHISQLDQTISRARPFPGDNMLPAVECEINGKTFRAEFFVVNRECYDSLPTPTLKLTVDGKRISRANAYAIARAAE
jgi:hypothetical protein